MSLWRQATQKASLVLLRAFCPLLYCGRSPAKGRAQAGKAVSHVPRVPGPGTFAPGLSLSHLQWVVSHCQGRTHSTCSVLPAAQHPWEWALQHLSRLGSSHCLAQLRREPTQEVKWVTAVPRALYRFCTSLNPRLHLPGLLLASVPAPQIASGTGVDVAVPELSGPHRFWRYLLGLPGWTCVVAVWEHP